VAYNELIKHYSNVKKYIREFYIYGFKNRNEIVDKSLRSYDNERRRIENYLGDYLYFTQSSKGRNQTISIDARKVKHNPFYKVFKAKSFTDITLIIHFCLIDLLEEDMWYSLDEIVDLLYKDYFNYMYNEINVDRRTIAKKVELYVKEGIIQRKKAGRKYLYKKEVDMIDLSKWQDILNFFSETNPLGVIGSFLIDRIENKDIEAFSYKHHYMLYALDSDILEVILEAMEEKRNVNIKTYTQKLKDKKQKLYPIKIYISTQTGRQYLLAYNFSKRHLVFYRIDNIKTISLDKKEEYYKDYEQIYQELKPYLWGVMIGEKERLEHFEMVIRIEKYEQFIVQRLIREKRNGHVEKISDSQYKYSVDTFDVGELLPWVRTFIGRIEKIDSTNRYSLTRFRRDYQKMCKMYEDE